jgi:glycosyltransferase involved in cell wall biosynthesis
MSDHLRIAALIPAYNEAERIGTTVKAAQTIAGVVGVIVANDGSHDATAQRAMEAGALVVSNERNGGKGAALELAASALETLRPFGALDGVLLLDGDLSSSACEAAALLEPLTADTADLVIAVLPTPPAGGRGGFGLVKGLARDGIAQYGCGFAARAPLSGQRALTMECLARVRPFAQGFAVEVAMTIKALQQKQRVAEVPAALAHRHTGRTLAGFWHRGRQFMDIYRLLRTLEKQHKI